MSDFVEKQWSEYKTRMKETAEYLANDNGSLQSNFLSEMESFAGQETPGTYPQLLKRIAEGNKMVLAWQEQSPRELASSPGQTPYADSEHHEEMPQPETTMAQQAADARATDMPEEQDSGNA